MTRLSMRFAWIVGGLAGVAALAGLFAGIYRDVPAMVEQAQAADRATLFVAVPLLLFAIRREAKVVAAATLAYLAYTYAIFSFEIVVNPLATVYIAIFSLSIWSLALLVLQLGDASTSLPLPRRTTAAFLCMVAVLFAALWLSDIATSIVSGALPPSVAALQVPTSAVYALDLGFVLPLFLAAAIGLVRRATNGRGLALGSLVFLTLMALSILPMFAFEAWRGETIDPVAPGIFTVIALLATGLIGLGGLARPRLVARTVHAT